MAKGIGLLLGVTVALSAGSACAQDDSRRVADAGKLLLTGGVNTVEGAGGGGMATWATISGYGTRDALGGNLHATFVSLPDFEFRSGGVTLGFYDRIELSYARQAFDTGATGAALGLGKGFTFNQDVLSAKLKLFGDAVYDQDSLIPQVAVTVQYKNNDKDAVVRAVGARDDSGVDYVVSATKVVLDQSLVLSAAARATKANQTGLLGFGGDSGGDYSVQFEGTASYLVSKRILAGVEYRTKPSNLGFAKEDDWFDVFVAYAVSKNLSVTAAYADLGSIATFRNQRGLYLSVQAGF